MTSFSNMIQENRTEIGRDMHDLIARLYPICRSITGDGVRQTLKIIGEYIPLKTTEVPTGTRVFDWTVPREWNIKDAYIKNAKGDKIVDFQRSNLHVLNYSSPVNKHVSLAELKQHLFTIPEHEAWIPYRTSYYEDQWAFCISHKQFRELKDEAYKVVIDSSLDDGHLTYAESYFEGRTEEEILISCHICHPSLCNDNLSGIAVSVFLAKALAELDRRYSYRFLFIPATIGSISWLANNEPTLKRIRYGLVAANLGDAGPFTYKKSRQGNSETDQVVINVLRHSGVKHKIIDFFPYGYDERQYGSPGINLPVGCLMRTPHGEYAQYHTSGDNLNFVRPESLAESLNIYQKACFLFEKNCRLMSMNPKCEPQLGRRGLYAKTGGSGNSHLNQMALLWVLNLSDGKNTLLDISDRSGLDFFLIDEAAGALLENGLLQEVDPRDEAGQDANR